MKKWIAVGIIGLVIFGCAAQLAQENVLVPAMEKAWDGIKVDVEKAIELLPDDKQPIARADLAEFDRAFRTGDLAGVIKSRWKALAQLCIWGIVKRVELGEIGEGVAESKIERLRMFYKALVKVATGEDV